MYIGHYAVAAALVAFVPASPVIPIAVGVAWPDLVWPVLVFMGRERVTVNRSDPLQRSIRFDSYPFSHSLVLSNLFTLVPAAIVAILYDSVLLGVLFWVAALSHWVLDLVVHLRDLPVLGFGGTDRTLGLGLWQYPRTAFVIEYIFFATVILLTARPTAFVGVLSGGLGLHLLNANSFFGFSRHNPFSTPTRLALITLVGYIGAIAWFTLAWQ